MANDYKDSNGIKRDYLKLSPENQHKAYQYMKNLLRLQRMESAMKEELKLAGIPDIASDEIEDIVCSFCHKPQSKVFRMIAGPGLSEPAYICDECVKICDEVLADEVSAANIEEGQ
ncbi:MAG: hypothetical protein LUG45_04645 [Clostridiales bacterium]|nr:hypothetical protein [Clostridiales bacterium]